MGVRANRCKAYAMMGGRKKSNASRREAGQCDSGNAAVHSFVVPGGSFVPGVVANLEEFCVYMERCKSGFVMAGVRFTTGVAWFGTALALSIAGGMFLIYGPFFVHPQRGW